MRRLLGFALALACAHVAPPPGKPELEGPRLRFLYPQKGDTVSGLVQVAVAAWDTSGVAVVKLFADGEELGADSAEPYTFWWRTDTLYDEPHTLRAEALDRWDNKSSASIKVFTLNGNEPPEGKSKR